MEWQRSTYDMTRYGDMMSGMEYDKIMIHNMAWHGIAEDNIRNGSC
jgi:hypothetical protein